MSDGGTIRDGVADFARYVSLWFAFGLATNGLDVAFDAALVGEPFGWSLQASSLVAVGAAFVVHTWYPDVRSGTVWRFGAATFLAFVTLGTVTGTMDARTNGSLYYVLKSLLVWVAAVSVGVVVAWTDD
ncbi:hypothetical protein [Halorussus sp. MSC15.2]|uniref:hypothetical protein n=1 Tax=Halorussus sp. MSC15.2 TaxID=2283638 RepID=UPI0013D5B69F|nr:hypothetical protein [Halorussus sp. MSC15.2]NEU56537.1 hypothetical protein [Halorussus sp. MSC15.2]